MAHCLFQEIRRSLAPTHRHNDTMTRVTLADVAKDCGLSAMTVSCVVRGIQCVKPETRNRVEKSIRKLGYQMDPTLRALAAYRTKKARETSGYRATIAYLDSEINTYSKTLFKMADEESRILGYKTDYFELPLEEEMQRQLSQKLWLRGIRGILLGPCQREEPIRGFKSDLFAMVGIGAMRHGVCIDSVCSDYFQGLYLAATRCFDLGFRRIGLLLPEQLEGRTGHRWLGAYCAFCEHYQIKNNAMIYGHENSQSQITRWVRNEKINAILTLYGHASLQQRFPEVRFVSLNGWDPQSDWWHIRTPAELIVREAVRLLDQNLCQQNFGLPEWPKIIFIAGHWVGDTAKPTATPEASEAPLRRPPKVRPSRHRKLPVAAPREEHGPHSAP